MGWVGLEINTRAMCIPCSKKQTTTEWIKEKTVLARRLTNESNGKHDIKYKSNCFIFMVAITHRVINTHGTVK